jgi:hypothetical protein
MGLDMIANVDPQGPPPFGGQNRMIFLAVPPDFQPGSGNDPDSVCQRNGGSGQALLPFNGRPAAEGITDDQLFWRPDGIFVGTGAQIRTAGALEAAITVDHYGDSWAGDMYTVAFTGETTPLTPGQFNTTCGDWFGGPIGNSTQVGNFAYTTPRWWTAMPANMAQCNETHKIICYQ